MRLDIPDPLLRKPAMHSRFTSVKRILQSRILPAFGLALACSTIWGHRPPFYISLLSPPCPMFLFTPVSGLGKDSIPSLLKPLELVSQRINEAAGPGWWLGSMQPAVDRAVRGPRWRVTGSTKDRSARRPIATGRFVLPTQGGLGEGKPMEPQTESAAL